MSGGDDALLEELAWKHAQGISLQMALEPRELLQIALLLKLALTHQDVGGASRAVVALLLGYVHAYFHDCPLALETLRDPPGAYAREVFH